MVKFSVVISTYNRLKMLQRAIDSLLNQTIACEIVVSDDCSSDGTQEYVKNLAAELGLSASRSKWRLIYHRNSHNQGHAATVNAGVTISSGDWIKFLDDDDYLAPNCLEEMEKAISLKKDAAICSCIAAQVNENETILNYTPKIGPGSAFYVPQIDIHYAMLLELLPFGTPVQVACSRDAFMKMGGWDVQLASCDSDDIDAWIRLTQFGDAIFLNQCLAYRTVWSEGNNRKLAIEQRLNTSILMKETIYALVNPKYQSEIPTLEGLKQYLRLHWAIVALKYRNINSAVEIIGNSPCCWDAWRLLLGAVFARRLFKRNSCIRKLILIN